MERLRTDIFRLLAICAITAFTACSDNDETEPDLPPTPPVTENGMIELSADGEQQDVTIPTAEPWEASSSADWLQLSQMGGKGGESVKVIAARNITDKERIGYIRFSKAPGTRTQTDSTQIVVRQQPSTGEAAPGVVLTAAYYKDGGIYVDIYNGRQSTSSMQELAADNIAFSFTDPEATSPVKGPIIYVRQGETSTANPYVTLNSDGVAEGKFSIAGEQSVNTLRVKQNIVFTDMGQLGNEGSAETHFTDGDLIYYGGGIVKSTNLGYEQTITSVEFRSYNTVTGEENVYADLPESGAGTVWNGIPLIIGAEGIYALNGGAWQTIALRGEKALAAAVNGNTLYAVTATDIETYALTTDTDGNVTATDEGKKEHGEYFGETAVTHDGSSTTWIMDDMFHKAYAINDGRLECTVCTPADSLNADFSFIGVADGCIYAFNGTAVTRYTIGDGTPEPLRMLGTFSWDGMTECVNGRLYNFGGTTNYRGTLTASHSLRRFTPADYVPISVAIMPE